MGDELWMSRYLMARICELYNVECSFDPKPIPGDWNGAARCDATRRAGRPVGPASLAPSPPRRSPSVARRAL